MPAREEHHPEEDVIQFVFYCEPAGVHNDKVSATILKMNGGLHHLKFLLDETRES